MAAAWLIVTPPAGAAPTGACDPGDGVTVVVDFGGVGGGVVAGCAPSPGTGFEALTQAGFGFSQVQSNPAFVCRIDDLPGTEAEDCADIPPATAFWSYWTADLGGSWRSSSTGAASPVGGAIEGWSFSTGAAVGPRFAVPAAPPATTTTTATPSTTTSTTTPPSTSTTTTAPTTTTGAAPSTTTAPPSTTTSTSSSSTTIPAPTTTAPVASATPAPTISGSSSTTALAAAEEMPASSPTGVIVGAVAIAGLAGGGMVLARRNRREPS